MKELKESLLKKLAVEAQRHSQGSKGRNIALTKLCNMLVRNSGKLCHPYKGQFPGAYEEIYAEALNKLCFYICKNIDKYDPDKGEFLQWANNFKLMRRFFLEARQEIMPEPNGGLKRRSLIELETKNPHEINPDLVPLISEEIMQFIEEDPEGIFREKFTGDNPAANFRFLAMQRDAGYSWKEIAQELNSKISTISSFYDRCLQKFSPKFREYFYGH